MRRPHRRANRRASVVAAPAEPQPPNPRATLKRNSVAYVDENFEDLVFLVPKNTAREWRFSGCLSPERATLSVFMHRGDPTLLLDLPSRTLLHLRPRDSHPLETTLEITATVRGLTMTDSHGRRADIDIVLV